MNNIKPLTPFRFWAQKVIPLVYDESLSYYELLCKVIDYLNKMGGDFNALLENFNEFDEDMTGKFNSLSDEFDALKEWAEDEFPEFVNTKLDEMAADGTLAQMLAEYLPFVTPEMFGAVGDGVTDDTEAMQAAVTACCAANGVLTLTAGKNYKLTETINITKRMILNGNGATMTSTADWALYVHSDTLMNGEFTVLRDLYVICKNGIKIESIRTQLIHSRIQNTHTAISVLYGSYESIISDCYVVCYTPLTGVGIHCESSDVFFDHVTGYGQHIFIENVATSSTFSNLHGWPIDTDYDGSIFFYEKSAGFSAVIRDCHSDTYQYAIRSTRSINHIGNKITGLICNWSNKPEGWLFYTEGTDISAWGFMRADVRLLTLPTTFHIANIDGCYCLDGYNFDIEKNDIVLGANCYCDTAKITINGDYLEVYLLGSVNTAQRTDLELYIPFLRYFGQHQPIQVEINHEVYNGQIVPWSVDNGSLKVQCSTGFTAGSGYVTYNVRFTRALSFTNTYTN